MGPVFLVLHLLSAAASRRAHTLVERAGSEEQAARQAWAGAGALYLLLLPALFAGWYGAAILLFVLTMSTGLALLLFGLRAQGRGGEAFELPQPARLMGKLVGSVAVLAGVLLLSSFLPMAESAEASGVVTADPALLDSIDKRIAPDRVEEIFALCRRLGIRTLAHFILGLPGETEESALHTIEFAKQIDPDFVSFNIATPKMGTRLREEAIEKGWTSADVDVLDNSVAMPTLDTGQLSPDRVWALRNRAIKEFHLRPSYIGRKLLSISSPRELWRMGMNAYALLESTLARPTSRAKGIEETEALPL